MELTKEKALQILEEASLKNPGNWINHSKNVSKAAFIIASNINLDPNKAYLLGLLHDIGRYKGIYDLRHILDGYNYMMELGYKDVSKICITHSFPIQNIKAFTGNNDCTVDEYQFLTKLLNNYTYDDYDRLIQLCDCIASHKGICFLETRLVDVTRRRGFSKYSIEKYNEYFKLLDYFSNKLNCNVYELLKDEILNTYFSKI